MCAGGHGARCREGRRPRLGPDLGMGFLDPVRSCACVRAFVRRSGSRPPAGHRATGCRPVPYYSLASLPSFSFSINPAPQARCPRFPFPLLSSPPSSLLPPCLSLHLLAVATAALDIHDDERTTDHLSLCLCCSPAPPAAVGSQASAPFYPLTDTAAVKDQARRRGPTNTVLDALKGTQNHVCFTRCGSALSAIRCC